MASQLKKSLKQFTPPILAYKTKDLINYIDFLKYKEIVKNNVELKDKHKGGRCFLLGSGPSIKDENLKPLKNEIVFALNNFYVHDDFSEIMGGNVEKYYMTAPIHPPQSEREWIDWFSDMDNYVPNNSTMLFGISNQVNNVKNIVDQNNLFSTQQKYWYYSGINIYEHYQHSPADIDISKMTWIADTVSIYALVFAIYMGFSEIYLLGMDHNYICHKESDYRFYKNAIHQKDEDKRTIKESSRTKHASLGIYKIFSQYELLSDNSDTLILNTSNNTLLDIFKYVSLKNII
jgi:hypothetical protein